MVYLGLSAVICALVVGLQRSLFSGDAPSPSPPPFECCSRVLQDTTIQCRSAGSYPTPTRVLHSRPPTRSSDWQSCASYCAESRSTSRFAQLSGQDKTCECIEGCEQPKTNSPTGIRAAELCISSAAGSAVLPRDLKTFTSSCASPFTVRQGDRVSQEMCRNSLPSYSDFDCKDECCDVWSGSPSHGAQLFPGDVYMGYCGSGIPGSDEPNTIAWGRELPLKDGEVVSVYQGWEIGSGTSSLYPLSQSPCSPSFPPSEVGGYKPLSWGCGGNQVPVLAIAKPPERTGEDGESTFVKGACCEPGEGVVFAQSCPLVSL